MSWEPKPPGTCADCSYFKKVSPDAVIDVVRGDQREIRVTTHGECRRRAPIIFANRYGVPQTAFPNRDGADWCGEHTLEVIR